MRNTIIECDRCAQHPLDPRRVETIGVTQVLAQRIAGAPSPAELEEAQRLGTPRPVVSGALDLCPKCQEMFVQFMNAGACFVPGTRVVR